VLSSSVHAGQIVDGLAFGIGQLAVLQHAVLSARAHHPAGNSTTVELSGTQCTTTAPAPILTLSPILILPSTLAPLPTTTWLPSVGVALAFFVARAAQRHSLVEQHIVAISAVSPITTPIRGR